MMDDLFLDFVLLAKETRIEQIARSFQRQRMALDTGDVLVGLMVLAGIVLALWVMAHLAERHQQRKSFDSPVKLFLSLAKAHKLGWSESWLLWRVARYQGLEEPARLFLEPGRFASRNLGPLFRLRIVQLHAIARRIFPELWETVGRKRGVADEGAEDRLPAPSSERPEPTSFPAAKGQPATSFPVAEETLPADFPVTENPSLDVPPWGSKPQTPEDLLMADLFGKEAQEKPRRFWADGLD